MARLIDQHLGRLLALSVAAFALPVPAMAQDSTAAEPVQREQAPAEPVVSVVPTASGALLDLLPENLRLGADVADRMTMPVAIGGIGPYAFIIDTGSQRSIVATELAQRLMLRELPPVQIVSMAGRETVASVHLDEMSFGKEVISGIPALSISRANLGSAGLIGLDGLKNKRLMLDFKSNKMEVGRSRPARNEHSDANNIIVSARSKLGQLILVNSQIDGHRVNVILDTGAEMSVGNMALFNSLKQKKLVIPPRETTITSVTGETIKAQFTVVRRITIESVTLTNVPMVFLDAAPFEELDLADRPSMLLGMRMLRMFDRVAIDFGDRHVNFSLPRGDNDRRAIDKALAAL